MHAGSGPWLSLLLCSAWRRALNSQQLYSRAISSTASDASGRSRIVFLGTPEVVTGVLTDLVAASKQPGAEFEVCAVVTKPPALDPSGSSSHGHSPVWRTAKALGFEDGQVLMPSKPKEPSFLREVERLRPDLCITAAYGGMLPSSFLDLPRCGTVNIHPSLLPRHRGAAPVQRTLTCGDLEGGVSLLYTVLKCDAGPVIDRARVMLAGDEQAPELTSLLFQLGSLLLLKNLPAILSGAALSAARPQDEALATHAAKVTREEARLDPSLPAVLLHNRVRGLAGWPGTHLELLLADLQTGASSPLQVPVTRTRMVHPEDLPERLRRKLETDPASQQLVHFIKGRVLVPCGGGTLLELLEIKSGPPAKFMHSLGKNCRLLVPTATRAAAAAGA